MRSPRSRHSGLCCPGGPSPRCARHRCSRARRSTGARRHAGAPSPCRRRASVGPRLRSPAPLPPRPPARVTRPARAADAARAIRAGQRGGTPLAPQRAPRPPHLASSTRIAQFAMAILHLRFEQAYDRRTRHHPARMTPPLTEGNVDKFITALGPKPAYVLVFATSLIAGVGAAVGGMPALASLGITLAAIALAGFAIYIVERVAANEKSSELDVVKAQTDARVVKNQEDSWADIEAHIDAMAGRPCANLLEHSTSSIDRLMMKLHEAKAEIRLLVTHPDCATSELQRETIESQLSIRVGDFQDRPRCLNIRLYRAPASIRGRCIGEGDDAMVAIGWYTYLRRVDRPGEICLTGHRQPMILSDTRSEMG